MCHASSFYTCVLVSTSYMYLALYHVNIDVHVLSLTHGVMNVYAYTLLATEVIIILDC